MCLTFTLGWLKQSPKNRHKNRKYMYMNTRTWPFHTFAPLAEKRRKMKANPQGQQLKAAETEYIFQ